MCSMKRGDEINNMAFGMNGFSAVGAAPLACSSKSASERSMRARPGLDFFFARLWRDQNRRPDSDREADLLRHLMPIPAFHSQYWSASM